MADDRREALLAAFNEAEKDETENDTSEGTGEASTGTEKENTGGAVNDNESTLESSDARSDTETTEDNDSKGGKGTTKETKETDAGRVQKDNRGSAPKSDSGKPTSKDGATKLPEKTAEEKEREAAVSEAPRSWKVATREHWSKLPIEVREEVKRREAEITQFIGQHGKAIQHKQEFDQVIQPFMPFIAAQQSTPMKAVHSLMTTAARLTTGAPQQKAQVVAEIIGNYGVDLKTLDEVLSGQVARTAPNAGFQNQNQPPAWAQPMFNFMSKVEQDKQRYEQRIQDETTREIQEFEKRPFYEDLREDMGMLMQRAVEKGQKMTLDDAYNKARKLNPDVDKILTQREQAAASQNGNGGGTAVQKARKAASSVKSTPAATTQKQKKAVDEAPSRRETLLAAFDDLSEG